MATTRAGGAAGEIADDLLRHVFARLPGLRDLLRCAATCKQWLRLVTERAFLRQVGLWPDTAPHPSVLAGVFTQSSIACSRCYFERSYYPRCPPKFLSLQAGGDGHDLTLDSFFTDVDDGLFFTFARPLASRRGLLLVRVWQPSSDSDYVDPIYHKFQLVVCRPMPMGAKRGSTHLLPPPTFDTTGFRDSDFTGYALLTDADYGDDAAAGDLDRRQEHAFRVVLNYTDREGFPCACTYSSATGSWSAPIKCCCPSALIRCGPHAGVVIHSIVHWLYMDKDKNLYALNVNTITTHITLTKIPIKAHSNPLELRPPIPCIAGEGMLSLVTIQQDHGVLEIWTKQGEDDYGTHDDHEGWQHSELADLGSNKINNVFFAESRGALLVQQAGVFLTVDLKSKETIMLVGLKDDDAMRHVKATSLLAGKFCSSTYCTGHHYRKCSPEPPVHVLYELDWVFSRTMLVASSSP